MDIAWISADGSRSSVLAAHGWIYRRTSQGREPGADSGLSLAPTDFHIKADHPVLVADGYDGDVPGYVVLGATDLLRGLDDIGGVAESQIVLDLLLDGDRRSALSGGGHRLQSLRVNLDAAVAEQALRAVVQGCIQRGREHGA